MADKTGRVVFIGNIPYGLTEEQIIHIFSAVGQVLSFRLVYDQETGRPKGFGFAEFADADSASSAVRNLNNHEVLGRELRVDFSHVGGKEAEAATASMSSQHIPPIPTNGYAAPQPGALPPLPPGVDLPAGLTCPDAISKTISTLQPAQLLDILTQMKGLVMGDPARATELLRQAPQLSYAIFQSLLLMGLVDTSVLASVVEAGSQPRAQQVTQHNLPPQPAAAYPHPPPQQQPTYGAPPQQYAHVPIPTPQPYQQQQAYHPPPPPAAPSQEDLLKQVLAMSQQQIDQLPPMERGQIMALRASMGAR